MADCDITNAHALSGRFLITALPTIFHCTGNVTNIQDYIVFDIRENKYGDSTHIRDGIANPIYTGFFLNVVT